MIIYNNIIECSKNLINNEIGVIKTDTLYGLVGRAHDKQSVERIYNVKNRDVNKPLIILISTQDQLKDFSIELDSNISKKIQLYWPGTNTLIFRCNDEKLDYLTKQGQSLAFRLPNDKQLCHLIDKTGPLVAPSANPEGEKPAKSIIDAALYFGEEVDFYVESGFASHSKASKIISLIDGEKVLRD